MNNTYQRIKDFIYTNLRKQKTPLPDDQISKEIDTCIKLIDAIGLNNFSKVLPDKSELSDLLKDDWERMQQELETQFDVKLPVGFLIQSPDQDNRDPYWWTNKGKQLTENFYWERYKNYLADSLNSDVIRSINTDTDIVMNNLESPDKPNFNRYGMVVGHVQSGKTGNYSALICKAADAGYNFIVVIAGGMNNLRDQTQERLNESFVGQNMGQQVGVGVGVVDRQKLPISLTTEQKDFNKQDADTNSQGLNFDNINVPILIVIKKNTKTLSNVITWLEKQYKNKIADHSMLVIDDESDYASINTKEENDPTKINERIRKLISLFQKSVYVAYTATPYANIFIDHQVGHAELGRDLFPKDFIYALDAPTDYFGARKIFLETDNRSLIEIDDYLDSFPAKHKKDHKLNKLPESLEDAIRHFILNISIRDLRGQSRKHNSMLIHASRFTNVHMGIANRVEVYLDQLKNEIKTYGMLPDPTTQSEHISQIKKTFELRIAKPGFSWGQVIKRLTSLISSVVVREVHQNTSIPLVYRKDSATNAIVVGGTSLSRGYTVEGLSVSYFLRSSLFYDTLMQMGRWFGYRPGYEDLCKIYLPKHLISNFAQIIESTEDLIDDFKKMSDEKMTPEEFGLAVKYHPDSGLQVTARNKQKNAKDIYFEMKLDGHTKETAWIHTDQSINAKNIESTKELFRSLDLLKAKKSGAHYVWTHIDRSEILRFLDSFQVYGDDDELGFRTRMPIKFIKKYVKEINTDWDISLHNGSGGLIELQTSKNSVSVKKETRGLIDRGAYYEFPNRKVSAGSAEIVALDEFEVKLLGRDPTSKSIASAMKRPLLMIHLVQNKDNTQTLYPAFGICFPGGIKSGTEKTIKLKINKVYLESIEEILNEDSDD
jgi:hypothetical protein